MDVISTLQIHHVALAAGVALLLSIIITSLYAWRQEQNNVSSVLGFGAHVMSWQMSAASNATFWFLVGITIDPISAVVLPCISISADIGKIVIPHAEDYHRNRRKRWGVTFLRTISIFATVGLGIMYAQAGDKNNQLQQLAQQEHAANIDSAQARVKAGIASDDTESRKAELQAQMQKVRDQITAIENQYAVNYAGDIAYKNNKKLTVLTATNGCDPSNAFTKISANGCENIKNLSASLGTLSASFRQLSASEVAEADSKENLRDSYSQAREDLKEQKNGIPVTEMIGLALKVIGINSSQTDSAFIKQLIFGIILAFFLETIVAITLPITIQPEGNSDENNGDPEPDNTGIIAKIANFSLISGGQMGDTLGTLSRQFSASSENKPEQGETAPQSLLEQLKNSSIDTLSGFIDIKRAAEELGITLRDGHYDTAVLMAKCYGENIATYAFYKIIRQQFGEGIKKDYIDDVKRIMARHNYLITKPYGSKGVTFVWSDERAIEQALYQFTRDGLPALATPATRQPAAEQEPVQQQPLKLVVNQ